MKNGLFAFPYSWIWFFVGMLAFGIPADQMNGSGSRNLWGAIGGVLFVAVGGLLHRRRSRNDAAEEK